MKKKVLSLILASAMALFVCACSNTEKPVSNESETATSETVATASTETVEEPEEYVPTYPISEETITITGMVVGREPNKEGKMTRILWDTIEEYTNIHVEWVNLESQDAVATYLASSEWPDIIQYKLPQNLINDYGILGGRFVNFLDYLDIMPNLKKTFEDYPTTLAGMSQINGAVYSTFAVSGGTATSVVARPHVRTDVLEDAGITELPKTIDEFYEQLKVLKEKNGVPGFILGTEVTSDYAPMLFAAFGTLHQIGFDDDGTGKVTYTYTSDQMKHYYEFLHKLYDEELMHREWLTLDGTTKDQLCCAENKVAFITRSQAQRMKAENLKDGNWDYMSRCLPPLTSEYDSTQTLAGVIQAGGENGPIFVNAESDYVEEIMKMLDIAFATEEVVEGSGLHGMAFNYGVEGIGWDWNSDGTYTQYDGSKYGYGSYTEFQLGGLLFESTGRCDAWGVQVTSTVGNARARQLGFTNDVIPYQITEGIFPESSLKFTEDEQMVIDQYMTEIKTYATEMSAAFITGTADIEKEWDEYVATFEKMSLGKVLEVYQAAYDRWNATLASLK